MRMYLSILLLCLLLVDVSHARYQQSDITTFILVRHAEKVDDSKDPELSPAGIERAELLTRMLSETEINAVYSTNLSRTTETIRRIAEQNETDIKYYSVQDPDKTANIWLDKHIGNVVIVSGHSNTTPTFANALLGREHFKGPFDESDYGNLLIITITSTEDRRLLHLRY